MTRLSLLALAFAGANASLLSKRQDSTAPDEDYADLLQAACRPTTDRGYDFNAPCNAVLAIQYECMYGPVGGEIIRADPDDMETIAGDGDGPGEQPAEAQRICFCQSQFEDMIAGCMKCLQSHGGVEGEDWFDMSNIDPVMEKYCDANTLATEGFDTFFYNAVERNTSADGSSTSVFSDPIGTATDVSLYSFTPSVTGR